MANYYDEVIADINSKISKKEFAEARVVIEKELGMPYIPEEIEKKLRQLQKEVTYQSSEATSSSEPTLDNLLDQLFSETPRKQLVAAIGMCKRNLRDCVEEIQKYLKKNPCDEVSALLIEALIEQQISDELY